MYLGERCTKINLIHDKDSGAAPALAPAPLDFGAILLDPPVDLLPSGVDEPELASPRETDSTAMLFVHETVVRVRLPLPVVGDPPPLGVDGDCLEPSLVKGQNST